jgi:hypothetical protein
VGGYQAATGESRTLAERWDGSSWQIQPTPNPTGARFAGLADVSCWSPRACIAVGDYQPTPGDSVPLALYWDGRTWTLQSVPVPEGSRNVALEGVSCAGPNACTAAGQQFTAAGSVPLVERWDGRRWRVQETPVPPGASFSLLGGVSCASRQDCTAVGLYAGGGGFHTLAERWDGRVWRIEPTPDPVATSQISLIGVSCARPRVCTAVGFSQTGDTFDTLAERSQGGAWAIQPTPSPARISVLSGVSCPAPRVCVAVGTGDGTLAERWSGGAWAIEPIPDPPGATDLALIDVSCATERSCTAVGTYFDAAGTQFTLAEGFTSEPD